MTELTLEALGLSRDEIIDRMVDRLTEKMLRESVMDGSGDLVDVGYSPFAQVIHDRVMAKIDQAVEDIAARNVLPNVASYVEKLTMQETNKWGEKTGQKLTFTEYLVKRAEAWITEPVDYQGKPKGTDSYSWRVHGTRIGHMIHEHLDHQIQTAIKQALTELNSRVAKGLHETVRVQLAEVLEKLKVEVKTR